ncbi:MAG TPA: pyrrolo-quinoline quinone [Burkholderiales bacterium]|nr:pyrrolo-quinoline quinone [Burkholderiales bacterium]
MAPTSASVTVSATQALTATVANDPSHAGVTWNLSGAGCSGSACGTLSATSGSPINYTAPATVPTPATVSVVATSNADSNAKDHATITITSAVQPIAVSVSPRIVAVTTSQRPTFTANVTGSTNTSVNWRVDNISGGNSTVGTVSAGGLYTPPSTGGTHTITAISQADSTKSGSATVAVTDLAAIVTFHVDVARTGHNPKEFALTPARVGTPGAFGKLFACAVDGQVYAQPLYVANMSIAGGTHNVLFVATEHDSVYAFDADSAACTQFWKTSFLGPNITPGDPIDTLENGDLIPEIGITSTPVIDVGRGAIYVVAKTKESGTYFQRLHALDLTNGTEKFGGPTEIQATYPGNGSGGNIFDPLRENQRAALLLLNSVVYIAWASHGDHSPYHGWIIGYDAGTLQRMTIFNTTPNGDEGGIWMSGGGPAADSSGNIYVMTGNGTFDPAATIPPVAPDNDFGESFLRLSTAGGLAVADFFTPANQDNLNLHDWDLGSGAPVVLPDSMGSSAYPHLLLGADKQGSLYLIDRDNMGRYSAVANANLQTEQVLTTAPCILCGFFDTPAVFGDRIYVAPISNTLQSYEITNASITTSAGSVDAATDLTLRIPGAVPVVSSQAGANGIVWLIDARGNGTNGNALGPAVLRAYNATNLAGNALYHSDALPADQAGNAVKFVPPLVANGKVYVAGQSLITVYGLTP